MNKLQKGLYYIKLKGIPKTTEINYFNGSSWNLWNNSFIEEVLAKVPTYEEHQSQSELINELVKALEMCRANYLVAIHANNELLFLKKTMPEVVPQTITEIETRRRSIELEITRLDQALAKAKEQMK